LEIVIPPRAGPFSTLRLLASLQKRNARFRDPISKSCKGLPEVRRALFDRLTVTGNKPAPGLSKGRGKHSAAYEFFPWP
jgi:hypothetical protein